MEKFKLNKVKLIFLMALLIISISSGLLFWRHSQTKKSTMSINALFIPKQSVKGEDIPVIIEVSKTSTELITVTQIFLELNSITYEYNTIIRHKVHIVLSEVGSINITTILKPLLNGTQGYYALNVGQYQIKSVTLSINSNETMIKHNLEANFEIVNQAEQDAISNGDFEKGLADWQITQSDNNTEVTVEKEAQLNNQSLCIQSLSDLNNATTTWVCITQIANLTNTHYLSFEVLMQGEGSNISVSMKINGITQNGSITLSGATKVQHKIVFGYIQGENNVTLEITIHEAKNGTKIFLDNIIIRRYEYTVFVVVLNEYWQYHGIEQVRD
ncbi:MAG: hypothetical protein ACTSYN_04190, partial [Candidatus Heimdallarchaeaceae archaeon]